MGYQLRMSGVSGRNALLNVSKTAPNRLDILLSGSLDADSMRDGLDALIAQAQDVTAGRMLYTILDFSMPTLGAVRVEIGRIPKLFGVISRFEKCAVLSDQGWLRKAAEIEGALFPGLEIKSFTTTDGLRRWFRPQWRSRGPI